MVRIALDAGHGLYTAGKRCLKSLDPKETREWTLNDRIMDKLEAELKNYDGYEYIRVDDTSGAKDISLANRVKSANNYNADLYVSMHHNAGIKGGSGGGIAVYNYYDNASKIKAQKLYNNLISTAGLVGNRATPIADGKGLYVVKNTKMICLLIENGFMDSKVDVPIILSEDFANKTVAGIINFLVAEYGIKKKVVTPTFSTPSTSTNKNLVQIAKDVRNGKYGNGATRVNHYKNTLHLTDTEIVEVKKLVNMLCNGVNINDYKSTTTFSADAPSTKIEKGDTVSVIKTSLTRGTTYTGGTFRVWRSSYTVMDVKGDRVVIGVNGVVTAAVNIKNLTLMSKAK